MYNIEIIENWGMSDEEITQDFTVYAYDQVEDRLETWLGHYEWLDNTDAGTVFESYDFPRVAMVKEVTNNG